MAKFRFEDLEIWKMAIDVGNKLFDISDNLEKKNLFRFAEQLRGAGMSISNNIAEGSGSLSKKDFAVFLNYAHRSAFECANILTVLFKRNIIDISTKETLFNDIDLLCRKIENFRKSLNH
jgi:four helix bundle protein